MNRQELYDIFVPLGWHTADEFEILLPDITKKDLEEERLKNWNKKTNFIIIAYWRGYYTFFDDCVPYTTQYPDIMYYSWDIGGLYIDNDCDEDSTNSDFVILWKENEK
jgi:hypothetical protein